MTKAIITSTFTLAESHLHWPLNQISLDQCVIASLSRMTIHRLLENGLSLSEARQEADDFPTMVLVGTSRTLYASAVPKPNNCSKWGFALHRSESASLTPKAVKKGFESKSVFFQDVNSTPSAKLAEIAASSPSPSS